MDSEAVTRTTPAALGGLFIAAALIWLMWSATKLDWWVLGQTAGIVFIGAGLMFATRVALQGQTVAAGPEDPTRARIAPFVIGVGTVGVTAIAIVVLAFLFSASKTNTTLQPKLDTILLSVFTATISVFATWVGTVLAFYFTNESFRQAAESTEKLVKSSSEPEALNSPLRMIPYDRITKIELKDQEKAEDVTFDTITALWTGDTVTRIPIFNHEKRPVYVIRKALASTPPPAKVSDYLAQQQNKADAQSFRIVPLNATVAFGRETIAQYKVSNLFITDRGQETEPTKGWVPDDRLAS